MTLNSCPNMVKNAKIAKTAESGANFRFHSVVKMGAEQATTSVCPGCPTVPRCIPWYLPKLVPQKRCFMPCRRGLNPRVSRRYFASFPQKNRGRKSLIRSVLPQLFVQNSGFLITFARATGGGTGPGPSSL